MIPVPPPRVDISVGVSEVLDDIGVNEGMIKKTRRAALLKECLAKTTNKLKGDNIVKYYFGSQSEGTTTLGLRSDQDVLSCHQDYNIVQHLGEYKPGFPALMMVRDKSTPQGYCFLQFLSDYIPSVYFVKDSKGRIFLKNTIVESYMVEEDERQGPSCAGGGVYGDLDFVIAFHCKSWPDEANGWLERSKCGDWPSDQMKTEAAKDGCFVVPTGKKGSESEVFQWRISTSLAERYLTFSLNVTHIRCFILMKMILKRIIKPQFGTVVSSFMCKTVLFYCIENTSGDMWQESKLMACLRFSLTALQDCIVKGNCPHYIIPGNNLISGKITPEIQQKLSEIFEEIILTNGRIFFGMEFDSIGSRLQQKFKLQNAQSLPISADIVSKISSKSLIGVASYISLYHEDSLSDFRNDVSPLKVSEFVSTSVSVLESISEGGEEMDKVSSNLLLPLFKTSLASFKAAVCIRNKTKLSEEMIQCFEAGFDSDVSSSRLKLASALYCSGNILKAEETLRETEHMYDILWVEPICLCHEFKDNEATTAFKLLAHSNGEEIIKCIVAFCVRFIRCEKECIPKELQYEFYKSNMADLPFRGAFDDWMDSVVVDSLPFLYFLFYKAYGLLGRREDQKRALSNLIIATNTEPNLGHRETALNILGQCMEQEKNTKEAFRLYLRSLELRERNNVAKIHICKLLARLIGTKNTTDKVNV